MLKSSSAPCDTEVATVSRCFQHPIFFPQEFAEPVYIHKYYKQLNKLALGFGLEEI